jgi:hypothetical protein
MALDAPGKWIHKVYGAFMLMIIVYAFLPGMSAKKEMKGFCEALPAGTSVAAAQTQAAAHDYAFTVLDSDHAVVDDEGSFGPQKCDLRFDATGLVSSTYSIY